MRQTRRGEIDADLGFGQGLPRSRPGIEDDELAAAGFALRQADGEDEMLAQRAASAMQDDRTTGAQFGFDKGAIDREIGADVAWAPRARAPAAMQARVSSIIADAWPRARSIMT